MVCQSLKFFPELSIDEDLTLVPDKVLGRGPDFAHRSSRDLPDRGGTDHTRT